MRGLKQTYMPRGRQARWACQHGSVLLHPSLSGIPGMMFWRTSDMMSCMDSPSVGASSGTSLAR